MKKIYDTISKIKSIVPKKIKPKFKNGIELLKWNQNQGILFSKKIFKKNKILKKKNIIKSSGIKKLYINCSFKNYKIYNLGQKKALKLSKEYAKNFKKNMSNFIFSGNPGTGKNHLATAILKYLIKKKKKVLIITISQLMSDIKQTFHSSNLTEFTFIKKIGKLDLLIIDEIGIQNFSKYEKIIMHQIIDIRSSKKKSTGILSNLNIYEIKKNIGNSTIDRMRLGKSLWINFNWESYRKNIF